MENRVTSVGYKPTKWSGRGVRRAVAKAAVNSNLYQLTIVTDPRIRDLVFMIEKSESLLIRSHSRHWQVYSSEHFS